jgi:hypothetical protein
MPRSKSSFPIRAAVAPLSIAFLLALVSGTGRAAVVEPPPGLVAMPEESALPDAEQEVKAEDRPDSILLAYGGRVVPPMESSRLPAPGKEVEHREWPHALPFFAQRVVDRGIELPNPYNVGFSYYYGSEDRVLSDLAVGFNGGQKAELDFVHFTSSHINPQSLQFQAGAWLFPFLNIYGILGYTQGKGEIEIEMPGRELMEFLGVPGCNLGPGLRPELCDRNLQGTAHADYDGVSYGVGLTLAGAWKQLFFSLPVTYVESDISMSTTPSKTWNIAPRVGWNQHLDGGMVTWYTGGTYMISKVSITGSFVFPTAGTAIGQDTTLDYSIRVEPKDAWNYLAGAHWMISKSWSILGEVGFGGSRDDLIIAGFYRF